MVVEEGEEGRPVVRGIFSASQLEAQLGTPVSPSVPASAGRDGDDR